MKDQTPRLDVAPNGGRYRVGDQLVDANGVAVQEAAPAEPAEPTPPRDERLNLGMDALREQAVAAGADADAVAKMRAKAEVIAALDAAQAEE